MKFSLLLASLYMALFCVPSLFSEDIVNLKRKIPVPGCIRGGTVNIENGRIDLHPPYVAHFLENKDSSFKFIVDVDFRDSTPRQTITGRVEVNLYREIGDYGSMNWDLFWAGTREIGSTERNPRLLDQYKGPFESPILWQSSPLRRYRVEMKASTHGQKGRNKRLDYIFSVVSPIKQGTAEMAIGLLLSREASLVHKHFSFIFNELTQKSIDRKEIRFGLQRFHLAIRRFNYLIRYLAANPLLDDRFAFGHGVTQRALELSGITPLAEHDIALPHYFVLDKQILEGLRKVAMDRVIDFEKAFEAAKRVSCAIEKYAYEKKWSVENLNHELYASERLMVINEDSYSKSLLKASKEFDEIVGKLVWSPGDSVPEQKYLRNVESRTRRFFDVPRFVANMEVTALRAIRAVNGQ